MSKSSRELRALVKAQRRSPAPDFMHVKHTGRKVPRDQQWGVRTTYLARWLGTKVLTWVQWYDFKRDADKALSNGLKKGKNVELVPPDYDAI